METNAGQAGGFDQFVNVNARMKMKEKRTTCKE